MRSKKMSNVIRNPAKHRLLQAVALGLSLAGATALPQFTPPAVAAAPASQPSFASPEDAVAALIKAVQADDTKAMAALLGPGSDKLTASGDPIADKNSRKAFLEAYAAQHAFIAKGKDSMMLTVGTSGWTLPFPVVQTGGKWQFDATAGAEEIINRRIGRNELSTIRTLLAGVAAQQDYFDRARRGSGTGFYAQRTLSTPGKFDGLYWDAEAGDPPSPLDPLVQAARDEGYPGRVTPDGKPAPYHGYLFRILRAQGPSAPGGAKEYVRNGQMTEGFAILAWPAQYGNSGVVSFIVGPAGVVFQKDLGANTANIAGSILRYDPDPTWARVDIKDE
jgi:hypothetical protein